MSVYVDDLVEYGADVYAPADRQAARVGARNGHRWCHLFADEPDAAELHTLAARIGLKRAWFQGDHYDLTPGRRAAAVRAGALEVDRRRAVAIWRAQGPRRRLRCKACGGVVSIARGETPPARCPACGRTQP